MTLKFLCRALVALATPLLLARCEPHDVEVADLSNANDGGGSPPGAPCKDNAECSGGEFCDRATCGEPFGRCTRVPAFCAPDLAPVCGCDQVTYWNDCLRRLSGMSMAAPGECVRGASCLTRGETECPSASARCGRLLTNPTGCRPDVPGTCWVLPSDCPRDDRGQPVGGGWEECGAPGPGPSPMKCMGLCETIRSEKVFKRSPPNECR